MKLETSPIAEPGIYRHYKGKYYMVIGNAVHTETQEPVVVYQALYGTKELWVRPARMWNEIVDVKGKRMRRFERVNANAKRPTD